MSGKPEDKEETARIEFEKRAQQMKDQAAEIDALDTVLSATRPCPYTSGKPVSTQYSPRQFDPGPNEAQRRVFATLPIDAQETLAKALIEEMRSTINHEVYRFEQKTGLVVDRLTIGREVAYCGFPQPVINASACSVEEFKETEAYRGAEERHFKWMSSHGPFRTRPFSAADCGYSGGQSIPGKEPDA